MSTLLKLLDGLDGYKRIRNCMERGRTPVMVNGCAESQKCHLAAGLIVEMSKASVIVASSELKAKAIYEDMRLFLDDRVKLYPAKDIIFYSADLKSTEILKQRFAALKSIFDGENPCIVLSADALLDRLPPKSELRKSVISLKPGDIVSLGSLAKSLSRIGYERVELVEAPGHFAIRGGILDIYTAIYDYALRIDFFDDEVESIKFLDTYSQRSIEVLSECVIYPMRELVYDDERLEDALRKLSMEATQAMAQASDRGDAELADKIAEHAQEMARKLRAGSSGADECVNYFYPDSVSLFSYLPEDSLVFMDEPNRIASQLELVLTEFSESIHNRIMKGMMLPSQANLVFSYPQLAAMAGRFKLALMSSAAATSQEAEIAETVYLNVKPHPVFQIQNLEDELKKWRESETRVFMLAGARYQAQRLADEIVSLGFSAAYEGEEDADPRTVIICRGALKSGFEYPEVKTIVTTVSAATEKKRKRRVRQAGAKIESFTDLRPGDYVVHDNHGIGMYEGIEQIQVDGISRDYLKLNYADGGILYISTSQMDLIQKFIGGDGAKPKLSKMGGVEWSKAKNKARKAVAILAKDLVELYAKRQNSKGVVYTKDNVWQKEFEDNFEFQETEDQLLAIEDVKADMESGKVMDRLICGDVGYGKTEVAIRAAFKTTQDGRQVAYLVPTTILAQQHFNTFTTRMKGFAVQVEMLSRFRTQQEQKGTIERLKNGTCDIVIGTHRLLSKDVVFKNLGMVIVDEEQRFGVTHKEKLKALKGNVNVLTLTATPIPRTLHMSLAGIRDMSVLEEPPQERQPIQTYVMEFSPEFVRDAITREIGRGGQVYYLHNRVMNIEEEAKRVGDLVPEASVAFAHGQMSERELETIMLRFISGELQVLVCTTIIETGLDISNVNTIIIQDADYMGLSQLYQLRGRVGRSNRLAYAYLMYRRDKVLAEVAEKRLQTIREFTEFGSGFKIAMRDLEIRGAGNLLGAQQHGHMDAIGYDMYCKLLAEAVGELSGTPRAEDFDTFVDAPVSACIPPEYIPNEEQKLEIYKKISLISNTTDYAEVKEEIEDRYGTLPKTVDSLLFIALLKASAHAAGVLSVVQKGRAIVATFKSDIKLNQDKIAKAVTAQKGRLLFTQSGAPSLTYKMQQEEAMAAFRMMKKILDYLRN
ncbi:MAG: transcription-repair coupling factor [Clostridiales bacterium]|jgi:transcription-repair coupling factor (superfamily II helicase)|nr:transcription-repair coupling factor [Clostridiales bacterium]